MNYVLIAIIAVSGYMLAAVLAFVLYSQGRDREVVEARLYTERDDALLRCVKLTADNEQYSEAVVELNEEKRALAARNIGLLDALHIAQRETVELRGENDNYEVRIMELLSQIGKLEDALEALRVKRTTKKAINE